MAWSYTVLFLFLFVYPAEAGVNEWWRGNQSEADLAFFFHLTEKLINSSTIYDGEKAWKEINATISDHKEVLEFGGSVGSLISQAVYSQDSTINGQMEIVIQDLRVLNSSLEQSRVMRVGDDLCGAYFRQRIQKPLRTSIQRMINGLEELISASGNRTNAVENIQLSCSESETDLIMEKLDRVFRSNCPLPSKNSTLAYLRLLKSMSELEQNNALHLDLRQYYDDDRGCKLEQVLVTHDYRKRTILITLQHLRLLLLKTDMQSALCYNMTHSENDDFEAFVQLRQLNRTRILQHVMRWIEKTLEFSWPGVPMEHSRRLLGNRTLTLNNAAELVNSIFEHHSRLNERFQSFVIDRNTDRSQVAASSVYSNNSILGLAHGQYKFYVFGFHLPTLSKIPVIWLNNTRSALETSLRTANTSLSADLLLHNIQKEFKIVGKESDRFRGAVLLHHKGSPPIPAAVALTSYPQELPPQRVVYHNNSTVNPCTLILNLFF